MKGYVSAILIPCLLMQLVGCYSYQDIKLEELQRYYGPNEVRVKTDADEIVIKRYSTSESRIDWEMRDSSILIRTVKFNHDNTNLRVVEKKDKIKYQDIRSVELLEYDGLMTGLLVDGILVLGVIIIAGLSLDNMDLHLF